VEIIYRICDLISGVTEENLKRVSLPFSERKSVDTARNIDTKCTVLQRKFGDFLFVFTGKENMGVMNLLEFKCLSKERKIKTPLKTFN
jgi:hypothetical protein